MEIYGIKIKCFPEDLSWIKSQIDKVPNKHLVNGIISKYSEVYGSASPDDLQQLGAARRNANSRLRIYVQKLLESQK